MPIVISREDLTEFLFRILFCIIFIGLGAEHLFKDDLIRLLMPAWVPWPEERWTPKFGQCVKLGSDLNWKDKES